AMTNRPGKGPSGRPEAERASPPRAAAVGATAGGAREADSPPAGNARGDTATMDKIVALCKRRGFVFPSSEIYGGVGSTYDFGHYGVLLKGDGKGEWWRRRVVRT